MFLRYLFFSLILLGLVNCGPKQLSPQSSIDTADLRIEVEGDRQQLALFERDSPLVGGIEKIYPRTYPRTYKSSGAVYDIRSKTAAFHLARQLSAKGLPVSMSK